MAFNTYGAEFEYGGKVPLEQFNQYQSLQIPVPWTSRMRPVFSLGLPDPSVYGQSFFAQFDPSIPGSLAQGINAITKRGDDNQAAAPKASALRRLNGSLYKRS